MRDAYGGAVNIYIIVLFILFALGYMAFNVNYTKAFRMKDKIVSVYEKYKGVCGSKCEAEIMEYSDQIGYRPDRLTCPNGTSSVNGLYCKKGTKVGNVTDMKTRCYYHIVTKINVDIPIFKNLLDIQAFNVVGDTKTIQVEGDSC